MEPLQPVLDSNSSVPLSDTSLAANNNTADIQEEVCDPVAAPDTGTTVDDDGDLVINKDLGVVQRDKTFQEASLSVEPLHPSSEEADMIDKLLAEEMDKLSFEEKERTTFDIHGMAQESHDPENINELLEQLEQEIRKIPNRKAYEKAKYLNEEYVTGREFRLLFLRCEKFDVKSSAQRIVTHLENKMDMFGGGPALARKLRLSDLNEDDDVKALKSGAWQLLPECDASGRLVVAFSPTCIDGSLAAKCHQRAFMLFIMSILQTEDAQKKGIVIVMWWSGHSLLQVQQSLFTQAQLMKKLRPGIPRRVAGVHFLLSQKCLRPLVGGIRWFLHEELRARIRVHFGDFEQLKFALQTFGISTDRFPFRPNNEPIDLENHLQCIQSWRKQEEKGNTSGIDIIVPRRFDVLFGRGLQTRNHTGNLRAAHIADMFRDKYEAARKYEKTAIAARIVTIILESHGRFLKWEDNAWEGVDQETARNKISHFYRNTRNTDCPSKSKASPSDGSANVGATSSEGNSLASALSKRAQSDSMQQSPQQIQKLCQRDSELNNGLSKG
ncbi:tocopherol transfer protein-like [Seminavis robusta]|uniref:Tocopherol transfer protein-like n=1 Tax=Seminavis robusta TaxID=568900 RepID=A0A9N8DL79_9STRA|nr:tocopherol transfer protein-like [Seminavis robusta]|eukprot:Sro118_g057620.1 tocopherol transfer protein-like (554) ;mRNA; r:15776-17617